MSIQQDYIMNQIENIAQFVAALISSNKAQNLHESSLDQTLAELTGLDKSLFSDSKNAYLLAPLLSMLENNQKALAAQLLFLKDQGLYGKTVQNLLDQVDKKNLDPAVRALVQLAPKT